MTNVLGLANVEQRLLNEYQRGFPLVPRPYLGIAQDMGCSENQVMATLARLRDQGSVSRVGATFRPGRVGAAILAALSVPKRRLLEVAEQVSACPEVNHNYEREHAFNLWFVITAPDAARVERVFRDIESSAGCGPALSLPMVESYHVDLGFDLNTGKRIVPRPDHPQFSAADTLSPLDATGGALVAAMQDGLPMVSTPYRQIGQRAGMAEDTVLHTLRHWLATRIINRLGVIVRHHELGYHANAMVVWDVPDAEVWTVGSEMAAAPCVSLCYQRRRQLPHWRYNLYCMIHGRSRDQVAAHIAELRTACSLARYSSEVLFSRQRFKQRGARYMPAAVEAVSHGQD